VVGRVVGRSARAAQVRGGEGFERVGVEAADEALQGGHASMVPDALDRSKRRGRGPRHEIPVTIQASPRARRVSTRKRAPMNTAANATHTATSPPPR